MAGEKPRSAPLGDGPRPASRTPAEGGELVPALAADLVAGRLLADLPAGDAAGAEEAVEGGGAVGPMDAINERLARIEAALDLLVRQRAVKDLYSTAEVAQLLGRAEFTVREWARLGRIHAQKRRCGRGRAREWVVPHAELLRIQNEGLLPLPEH